jgi:hypothetical protein
MTRKQGLWSRHEVDAARFTWNEAFLIIDISRQYFDVDFERFDLK